jgi:hypothetical protein
VTTVLSYDDTVTPRRVDYGYDQYGDVTSKLEYGFQVNGPWLRKTTSTYAGTPYTTSFMHSLLTGVNVYDPNSNQIAGTSYAYDGYGGVGLESYSQELSAPGHLSNYDSSYTLRGNVTTVTRLTNVAQGTSTSKSASYDIFGNQVQINLDCCNQKSFTYNQDTYWSLPDVTVSGGAGGPSLTNSSSYSFNTSALTSTTDPNGPATNYATNSWLEPTQVNPPSGAGGDRPLAFRDQRRSGLRRFRHQTSAASGSAADDPYSRGALLPGRRSGSPNAESAIGPSLC